MPTQRDKIWFAILQLIEFERTITAADVQTTIDGEAPTERTIRNTLDSMESLGLLESTGGDGRAPREFYPVQPASDSENRPAGYSPRKSTSSSIFPYPGSKAQLAEEIIAHMPDHDTYVELFGGAAGVLYNKPPSKYEIYNDINEDLVQFFTVLRNQPDELARWLQQVPYSRSQYEQWVDDFYSGIRPNDEVERAGRFFSLRYMQYIGASSSKNGFKSRSRRSPARTFANAKNRITEIADRFTDVTIENQDYKAILDQYDDSSVDVLFFADPPYADGDEHYDGEFDRETFVSQLHTVDNDWIVSLGEIPDELQGYTQIEKESRHRMKRSEGNIQETLIFNFNPEKRASFRK